jgi:6-phosphogluconolactonase (cycloisomerase 2 family)
LGGQGLGRGHLDLQTGRPRIESWSNAVADPSWLEVSADGRNLYAVSELTPDGLVHALSTATSGAPVLLNSEPTGAKPAHLALHPEQPFLFTSLYDGGSVSTHPIADDGTVRPASDVRRHSTADRVGNAHQVVIDPSGEFVLAVDLGLETVVTYRLDAEDGTLAEVHRTELHAGSGPRHLVFHPNGSYAYLANELDSTVTVCRWSDGKLIPEQILATLPHSLTVGPAVANYPGEILISADGRHVYVSNRGSNTIAVFAVRDDGATLTLLATPSCGGDWPRHLAIDRTGSWLYAANERSGDLVWFPLDAQTGLPGPIAGRLAVTGVAQIHLGQPAVSDPAPSGRPRPRWWQMPDHPASVPGRRRATSPDAGPGGRRRRSGSIRRST